MEPCLNCTCTRGALLCYLRVCPKLPIPPPPGCILLHRYRTCCPELICTGKYMTCRKSNNYKHLKQSFSDYPHGGNRIEARSDDEVDIYDNDNYGNACISNGSIYGPGSAMSTSSLCEYCYCLHGKQRCVKPRCLLPMKGCTPIYESHTCCPVRYNCTHLSEITSTTTRTTEDIIARG